MVKTAQTNRSQDIFHDDFLDNSVFFGEFYYGVPTRSPILPFWNSCRFSVRVRIRPKFGYVIFSQQIFGKTAQNIRTKILFVFSGYSLWRFLNKSVILFTVWNALLRTVSQIYMEQAKNQKFDDQFYFKKLINNFY
jgi:hypothetical protein